MDRKLTPLVTVGIAGKTYRPETPLLLRTAAGGRRPHSKAGARKPARRQHRDAGPQLELALE